MAAAAAGVVVVVVLVVVVVVVVVVLVVLHMMLHPLSSRSQSSVRLHGSQRWARIHMPRVESWQQTGRHRGLCGTIRVCVYSYIFYSYRCPRGQQPIFPPLNQILSPTTYESNRRTPFSFSPANEGTMRVPLNSYIAA